MKCFKVSEDKLSSDGEKVNAKGNSIRKMKSFKWNEGRQKRGSGEKQRAGSNKESGHLSDKYFLYLLS